LLERAWKAGFDVLMLTVDTWQLGWRPTDINIANYVYVSGYRIYLPVLTFRPSFYYPPGEVGNEIGKSDPVFMRKYTDAQAADSGKWIDSNVWHGKAHTWAKIPWLIAQWKRISGGRPFVLKGIQSAADAVKAAEVGCDGIVVTNHAGRQVDGAVGSLEVLPEIVDAVGDREASCSMWERQRADGSCRHEDYLRLGYPHRRGRVQGDRAWRTRRPGRTPLHLGHVARGRSRLPPRHEESPRGGFSLRCSSGLNLTCLCLCRT
jgi:hypothetical protein